MRDKVRFALQSAAAPRTRWRLSAVVLALLLLLGNLQQASADPGTITTVAGNGTGGFSGDGGAATGASILNPTGVVVDGAGNFYIAGRGTNRVHKVDANGVMSTAAGNGTSGFGGDGGPAVDAQLSLPVAVAVDGAGNLYIADFYNHRIRKVDANGRISTVAGNGTPGFSGDGGPATDASLNAPGAVAVDGAGNVYIADLENQRIRKVDAAGVISTVAGNGTPGFSGDGGVATDASLNTPRGVAVDGAGNLYIADRENYRIRKVDAAGIISTVAGNGTPGFSGDDVPATAASLSHPDGVGVDWAGNVYIADHENHRVRKVDAGGVITTVAGNGTAGFGGDDGPAPAAQLSLPAGVAFDVAGNLYIAEFGNNRVRKVEGVAAPQVDPQPQRRDCTQEAFAAAVAAGEQSGTLTLDGACRYVLTSAGHAWNGGSGALLSRTTVVEGNGAVIERSADAPAFRILTVQVGPGTVMRDLTIRNGNAGTDGGGLYVKGALTLENVTLEGNTAGANGGAIAQYSGALTVDNSRLIGNQTKNYGGAIFQEAGALDVTNTVFAQNHSTTGEGAALFLGGAVASGARVAHSTITDNAGASGAATIGAAVTAWSPLVLYNNIIANHGVAVYAGNVITEDHNLFANNVVAFRPGGNGSVVSGSNSTKVADPQFVDAAGLDYRLNASSPAVDKGTATVPGVADRLATDAAGLVRPFSGTQPDAGAYEFQGEGGPSLSIVKQGPPWLVAGTPANYSLTIANDGVRSGADLEVVDVLAAGAEVVSGSLAPNGTVAEGQVTWQIGTLAPGESTFITYTLVASQTLVSDAYRVKSTTEPAVIAQGKVVTTPLKSTVVAAVGFFPRPDGFSFANYSDSPDSDLTVDDMVYIFGEQAVCKSLAPCVLTAEAEAWRKTWLKNVAGGHCAGMAMGSIDIFANASVVPADFQPGANVTFDLTKDNARRMVGLYATTQGTQPVNASALAANGYLWTPANTPVTVLDTLIANLKDANATDRYRLSFWKPPALGGGAGHTVVPYAVEKLEDDNYLVYIYENNAPNQFDHAIRINRTTGAWRYVGTTNPDKPLMEYSGDATTGNLSLTSWQWSHNFPKACDFTCLTSETAQTQPQTQTQSVGTVEVQLDGEGYQLVTRSDGKQAGFDLTTGEWIGEIEGAQPVPILTGLGLNTPPAIRLPHEAGMTYAVEIASRATAFGNTEAPANVNLFGPGFVINVTGLVLDSAPGSLPAASAEATAAEASASNGMSIGLDPAAKQVTLAPGVDAAQAPSLALALTRPDGSDFSVAVNNVPVASGHAVALGFDEASQSMTIENNSPGETSYQVEVTRINGDGTQDSFVNEGLSDGGQAGVKLGVGPDQWSGAGSPAVEVQETSTLPAPTEVPAQPATSAEARNNTYATEVQWGGSDAPWNAEGAWVIGDRLEQRVIALDVSSTDDGQTLAGTTRFAGEEAVGFRATRTAQNTYAAEYQWGGEVAGWSPGGTWVLGGRPIQNVVAITIASADEGNTFDGTITYGGEEAIQFRASLAPVAEPVAEAAGTDAAAADAAAAEAAAADAAAADAAAADAAPAAATCDLTGIAAPTNADVVVRFVNASNARAVILWDKPGAELVEYHRLDPGATVDRGTFIGHVWVVQDEDGNELLVHTATDAVAQCAVIPQP